MLTGKRECRDISVTNLAAESSNYYHECSRCHLCSSSIKTIPKATLVAKSVDLIAVPNPVQTPAFEISTVVHLECHPDAASRIHHKMLIRRLQARSSSYHRKSKLSQLCWRPLEGLACSSVLLAVKALACFSANVGLYSAGCVEFRVPSQQNWS